MRDHEMGTIRLEMSLESVRNVRSVSVGVHTQKLETCTFPGWLHAWPANDSSLRTSGSQPASPSRSNELTVVSYL
jgi:hypothetical protein